MSIEVKQPNNADNKQNKKNIGSRYCVLDYASIRNLSKPIESRNYPMLPGLGIKNRNSFVRKQEKEEKQLIQQPKLLTTAKARFKSQNQPQQQKSETENSNFLGVSSFLNSRQITPINPLLGNKRRPFNKNKLNSVASELFDIQSNPQEPDKAPNKFKSKQFRLFDIISGQSQVVYTHVFGRERQINPKTILAWKDCLSHQDKTEIYLPVGKDTKVEIPYTSSRIYQLNQIQKGFKQIYGTGKNRSLNIGEQSIIIHGIERYLRICSKDPLKIGRKDYDIIQNILRDCKMQDLQNYPMCMKQVQTHFKLLATKWKYNGQLNHNDRIVQSALIMGKNNFLDLNRQNILTAFLLKHSNINDI